MSDSNINTELSATNGNDDTSLKELILSIKEWINYFLSKWYIIIIFGILGAVIGILYSNFKKPVFEATTSFVVESGGKSGGLGAYIGVAASFGIDLGSGGGGLFDDENIIELYRSRRMISKALLTKVNLDKGSQLLVDRFAEFKEYKEKWNENPELKNIRFKGNDELDNNKRQRFLQDSIIGAIVRDINKNYLEVEKKDKKLNIITVKVKSEDELFSKAFNEALVDNVNQFYLATKTKKSLENVSILQAKTDSVRSRLTGTISRAAAVADATPNQNPTRMAQRVAPIQNAKADAEINQEVLGTLLQNLEMSKISLLKETPLIQIVDEPILPLDRYIIGIIKATIIGSFLGAGIIILFLFIKKYLKNILNGNV